MFKDLSGYLQVDKPKRKAIDDLMAPLLSDYSVLRSPRMEEILREKVLEDTCDYCYDLEPLSQKAPTKYCPQCHREYPEDENFCFDCLVKLKHISDIIDVCDIQTHPKFKFEGSNDFQAFEDIFTPENIDLVVNTRLKVKDYDEIIKNIKKAAFIEFDRLVKSNELVLDYLDISDKVLLFSKSFVDVGYKSFGQELGTFTFDRIEIDDRQMPSLQITTLIHELSHFLLKEILSIVLCKILDCSKSPSIDAITTFILVYSPLNRLIDEYCAHSVEGRFTVYGYQDYSSFIDIQNSLEGEMDRDEIEIAKSIGNTFSLSIKEILESYIDKDLRKEIKDLFLMETRESPNYRMLAMENCSKLKGRGFMQAIWLILSEGFETASLNIEKLEEYKKNF